MFTLRLRVVSHIRMHCERHQTLVGEMRARTSALALTSDGVGCYAQIRMDHWESPSTSYDRMIEALPTEQRRTDMRKGVLVRAYAPTDKDQYPK